MHLMLSEEILAFARALRVNQTDAEHLLWLLLRNRSLGFKFRRQHPVGGFVVDFYCHQAHLGVELDGGQHNEDKAALKDETRTGELEKVGVRVIRFWNHEVLANTEAVLEGIYQELIKRGCPHPCPSPGGRGDVDSQSG